jgi:glycosyltransferase involved in cell wall biosynthesis
MPNTAPVDGPEAHDVDVVLPTRNRPQLTMEAIESVRAQTYPNWRLFVVDDASCDGTADLVARVARVESRLQLVRRREQGGSAATRQTGLNLGAAPYVATLDSDDLWYPTKLERQVACWNEHSAHHDRLGVVVCWHEYLDLRNGRESGPLPPRPSSRRWTPFIVYNTSTPLMSRAVLERVGGFAPCGAPRLRTSDHMDLYLRLTAEHTMAVVPDVLVRCRHHAGTRNSDAQGTRAAATEAAQLLERHGDLLAAQPKQRAWLHAWVAGRHFQAGDTRAGVRELSAGVRRAGLTSAPKISIHYGGLALRSVLGQRDGAARR